MTAQQLIAPLKQVALFQGLTPYQITEIARTAERIVFKPGDTIVAAGADGDAAYLIVGGDAVRVEGPAISGVAEIIAPGSLVGEMAMLIETEHSSTVVARTPVRALKITREAMLAHMAADPSIADHLVARISSRLVSLAEELRSIDQTLAGDGAEGDVAMLPAQTVH